MRSTPGHRYFGTARSILQATVDDDLPELECAIHAPAQVAAAGEGHTGRFLRKILDV